ncbi:hypothetical protein ACIGW8_20400 [Streptomyces sioyaensis]|uniref:hypothetical protein n=1 Tax=Streptomyces sioyaensis TaxID=67364 RepID=UPI0037D35D7E
MPDDSQVRSAPIGGWTKVLELLALIVDEVGILAADKRREEPTHVIRPLRSRDGAGRQRSDSAPQSAQPAPEQQAPRMTGHRQMLMAALQRGTIRSG